MGVRPGEKIHEAMITSEDSSFTYEYEDYYKIIPHIILQYYDIDRFIGSGQKVEEGFSYSSNNNDDWLSDRIFTEWLENYIKNPIYSLTI